jgi:hypothetical protein
VQTSGDVRRQLFRRAQLPIMFVHEDDSFHQTLCFLNQLALVAGFPALTDCTI